MLVARLMLELGHGWGITLADGTLKTGEFPDRNMHRPRLLYHRYFMLSEFVNTLASPPPAQAGTDAERDEALDRESAVLMERHLGTWRAYREQFYRPARAVRNELRRRLGIRDARREPSIPALDEGVLAGAKPITQAANYLAALARRLK